MNTNNEDNEPGMILTPMARYDIQSHLLIHSLLEWDIAVAGLRQAGHISDAEADETETMVAHFIERAGLSRHLPRPGDFTDAPDFLPH